MLANISFYKDICHEKYYFCASAFWQSGRSHRKKDKRENIEWNPRSGGQTTHRKRVGFTIWRQYSHLAGSSAVLIEKKKGHGGGIFVSQISDESIKISLSSFLNFKDLSIQHIYEARMILEPACARLAVERISPEEVIKLEENVSWCEEILNRPSQEFSEQVFFNIDDRAIEFHKIIVNSVRNPIVILNFDYVMDFLKECELQLLVPDKNHSMWVISDHRNILDFLKNGDGKRGEEEMYLHLKKIEEYDIRLKEFRKEHPEKKVF